ncbi:hypothetical protein O181_059165 [Austropuccinia psidii MF-1]|uniref:Uncharacterized protein n=1 Tax=Austropuccinia psidii MF-1 TaxID=1389203 RepID=A0A9Q3EAZ8_9BASI|nr:hypothetical protein [Austropuccinia psidii MF-1]
MVYGSKKEIIGASSKPLDRENEFLSSSEETLGPRKERRPFEGLDSNVFQRESPTAKSLVEKPKHIVRGPEEAVGPKEEQQPCRSSSSLHKKKFTSTSSGQGKASPKEKSEG